MTSWKWFRVLSDIVVLITLIVTEVGLFAAELTGRIVKRGFFCDDESIRLPLKQSTVPSWALVVAAPGIPITALVFGNLYERYIHKRIEISSTHYAVCCRPSAWVLRLGYEVRWYLIGLFLTLIVTDTGKICVGRLRPDFIDACDPDFSAINCTDEYGFPLYVTSYTCRGDEGDVNEARLSWPSGHASVSAYACTFVALYVIALRAFYPRSGLRLLVVLISLILALLSTVSRLTDNKHHPTDLLSGSVVGAAIAVTIVYYNLYFFGNFKEKNREVSMPVASYRLQEMTSIDRPPSEADENV